MGALIVLVALLLMATIVLTGVGLKARVGAGAGLARLAGRKVSSTWRERESREVPETIGDVEETPRRTKRVRAVVEDVPVEEPDEPYRDEPYLDEFDAPSDPYGDDGPVYEPDVIEDVDDDVAPVRVAPVPVPVGPSHWELPPLSLLATSREQRTDPRVLDEAGADLVDALAAHGV